MRDSLIVLGLLLLLSSSDSNTQAKAPTDDIDLAVHIWKEAGLPIPPASSVPICNDNSVYGIGAKNASGELSLYVGGRLVPAALKHYSYYSVPWSDFKKDAGHRDFMEVRDNWQRFPEYGMAGLAVQSAALGHRDIAKTLAKKQDRWAVHNYGWLGAPINESLAAKSAMGVYIHCANRLLEPNPDRGAILVTLERLATYKLIGKARGLMFKPQGIEEFIQAVRAANTPARTGSAIVDRLVDASVEGLSERSKPDAIYDAILKLGLDAVPPMVELLGSKALSRTYSPGMHNSPNRILTVDWLARDLLLKIAGGELGENWGITKAHALKWYEAKKNGSVEELLMKSLIRSGDGGRYCNADTFQALGAKYPHRLKDAYIQIRKAGIDEGIALRAIESSTLTKKEKRDLLVYAAKGEDLGRLATTYILHKFDREEYDRLLLRHFAKIPKVFHDEYSWIPNYAFGTANSEVWKLLDGKIKAADTSMRIAMLHALAHTGDEIQPQHPKKAIEILRRCFDDRSKPKDWNTNAALRESLQVREAPTVGQVALKAAAFASGILYVNVPEKISAAEWKAIRKRIEAGEVINHHG